MKEELYELQILDAPLNEEGVCGTLPLGTVNPKASKFQKHKARGVVGGHKSNLCVRDLGFFILQPRNARTLSPELQQATPRIGPSSRQSAQSRSARRRGG